MEVSSYGQQSMGHVALYIHPLYAIQLIDSHLPQYGNTHIHLRAAFYSCCYQCYGWFSNIHAGSYWWQLHWWHRGRLPGVCILAVCGDGCIWQSACQLAWCESALTWLRWLCIHDLLLWNRRARWQWKEVGSPEDCIVSLIPE